MTVAYEHAPSELASRRVKRKQVALKAMPALYSIESQRAVLGSALLDNALMRGPIAHLAIDDFCGSSDQTIYTLMLEFSEDSVAFELTILVEELRRRGRLETVGGAPYVASLIDGAVPEPSLVAQHVSIMLHSSRLRRLQSVAETLERSTTELGADPARLLQELESAVHRLQAGYDLNGNLLPYAPGELSRRPDLLTLSQVEAKEVNWLWKPYLPVGMLSMLSGDPGAGKTFIALAVAAAVTVGKTPYTGEPTMPADILYLSVENSPEHVLRPRFDLLGGDPRRFHHLRGSVTGHGQRSERGGVRLSDVRLLSDALGKTKACFAIVDPIQSYLGADVDAHRSNETRPVMDGLSRLAEEHGCCILLVRHLGKAQTGRAIHRGLGSIDLTGAVRTELLAGCSPDDPAKHALVQVKSNLGQFGPSLGYIIETDGTFRWTGESQLTAYAILAPEQNGEETSALAEAKDFLSSALAQGARPAKDVQAEAQQEGISDRTLKRAKRELKVLSRKGSMSGAWAWALAEEDQT
jgi:AAA domain/DnaB-like helicase N terminal domain